MVDKMMRMAGRGEDGLAKALSITENGELKTLANGGLSSIAKVMDLTIEPNQTVAVWNESPIINNSFFYTIVADVAHSYTTSYQWYAKVEDNPTGLPTTGLESRDFSDRWSKSKVERVSGDRLWFRTTNKSNEARTYNVYIWGIDSEDIEYYKKIDNGDGTATPVVSLSPESIPDSGLTNIGKAMNLTIEPNQTVSVFNKATVKNNSFFYTIVAGEEHSYRVSYQWYVKDESNPIGLPATRLESRDFSDSWSKSKVERAFGDLLWFRLRNNSSVARTYSVYIWGINSEEIISEEIKSIHDTLKGIRANGVNDSVIDVNLKYPKGRLEAQLIDNPTNFTPTQMGSDGYIYGVDQRGAGKKIYRTTDGFETLEEGAEFPDVAHVIGHYKTAYGYVVVASGGTAEARTGMVYFSTNFNTGYELVLETDIELSTNGMSHFFPNWGDSKGLDICLLSEYSQRISNPHSTYMTTDGGQSWEKIFTSTVNDPSVNAHIHTAVYDKYNGDIYISVGDTPTNRAFYRSTDLGGNFEEVQVPENDYGITHLMQPTFILPTPDRIFMGSDSGSAPGFYSLFKDIENINLTGNRWSMKWEVRVREGNASVDFPRQPYAEDNGEIYVCLPEFSDTGYRDYTVVGSGDNGRSWHIVYTQTFPPATFIPNGIVGVDKDGFMYQFIRTNVDGAKDYILKIKKGEWQ